MLFWAHTLSATLFAACFFSQTYPLPLTTQSVLKDRPKDARVLILGGGMAGVIAAKTLHEQGIDDFIIVEGKGELGGRMLSHRFGAVNNQWTIELGANWVQGTQTGDGPANPIWTLAQKHDITLQSSDYFGNVGKSCDLRGRKPHSWTHSDVRCLGSGRLPGCLPAVDQEFSELDSHGR